MSAVAKKEQAIRTLVYQKPIRTLHKNKIRILLICVSRAHIKLSIFENTFSKIEKIVINFFNFQENISKYKKLNVYPKSTH